MERWEQRRPQAPPPHRHRRNNLSFSSSLLYAIYRSLDDSDTETQRLAPSSVHKNWHLPPPPDATLRRTLDPVGDRRHRRFSSATSSSYCSNSGGLSSFDFDSTPRPRPVLTRSNLIRSDPPPPPEKKRSGRSVRSRIRNLQQSPASASPGARLAAFVNAIFAGGERKTSNRPKFGCRVDDRTWASPPSYEGRGKQEPVRISPVSVDVADDLRPTRSCGGEDEAAKRNPKTSVESLRGFEKTEDEEDCESVSSSDLFELESLSIIGRLTEELPLYEATNHGKSRAISRGFIM